MPMKSLLLAGAGGFIGTCLRYLCNSFIYRLLNYPTFPYGTCLINILGCLIIGLLSGLAESRGAFTPEVRVFIFIGILGGFTTFSTFGYETFSMIRDGQFILATTNVMLQVVLGLAGVWLGYNFSRTL
jgi:CrcB protein